ncbi:MAG TPA: hypothetical protein VG101_15460 [Puia sp.]|jgi:hypothetical protein|nr:hypothetical protein [Puia sp.]
MGILKDLASQIQAISDVWRLTAFAMFTMLLVAYFFLKSKGIKLPRAFPIVVIVLIFLSLALVIFSSTYVEVHKPAKRTLSVIVRNESGFICSFDEIRVSADNANANFKYAPATQAWESVVDASDLATDGSLLIIAESIDRKCRAEKKVNFNDPDSAFLLQLQCPHARTYSINIGDQRIQKLIADSTGFTFDPQSPNKLVFTFDHEKIASLPDLGSYRFLESPVQLNLNGNIINLDNCRIPSSLPSQFRQNLVDYANSQALLKAREYLRQHPNILIGWIKSLPH